MVTENEFKYSSIPQIEAVLKVGEIIINEMDKIDKQESKKKKHIDRMFYKAMMNKR